MNRNTSSLQSIQVQNFKAIRDSQTIQLTPLTVFIGYNGSGKSSVIESLETLQAIVRGDLNEAMNRWHGFEHVWNQAVKHTANRQFEAQDNLLCRTNPMAFKVKALTSRVKYTSKITINLKLMDKEDVVFIQRETATMGNLEIQRDIHGDIKKYKGFQLNELSFQGLKQELEEEKDYLKLREDLKNIENQIFETKSAFLHAVKSRIEEKRMKEYRKLLLKHAHIVQESPKLVPEGESLIARIDEFTSLKDYILQWQFLRLEPSILGEPFPKKRTGGKTQLISTGANIAEYLLELHSNDLETFTGILETLQIVLDYATDLQTVVTSELERLAYLQL